MPIHCAIEILPCSQDEFYELDHLMTGVAFEIQNELGRFLDEELYKRELEFRLHSKGLAVSREVRVVVSHLSYRKDYAMDLVVGDRVVVEAKTAERIVAAHKAQGMNYLYLSNTQHGTLLNFRPAKVEHEFLSTRLDAALRRRIRWSLSAWKPLSPACVLLRDCLHDIAIDWGCFLETTLYREALAQLTNTHEQLVAIHSHSRIVGHQQLHILGDDLILAVTTLTKDDKAMRLQLEKLLLATRLRAVQWINFNRHTIELSTIQGTP